MAEKFKAGDVVRLKSGGPSMTVDSYGLELHPGQPYCKWFDGSKATGDYFMEATLELVPEESSGVPIYSNPTRRR